MWIQTASGRRFDLLSPTPDMVHIEDIAAALSNLCRFTGHVKRFYSVAEHSVMVARLVPRELRFQALLHDAAEAYVGDVSRPLKQLLPDYRQVEERVWRAVAERFGLPYKLDPLIKRADTIALLAERRDLLTHMAESATWDADIEALLPFVPPEQLHGRSPIGAQHYFENAFLCLSPPVGPADHDAFEFYFGALAA